jgi:ribosome biogenesis protein BMS1
LQNLSLRSILPLQPIERPARQFNALKIPKALQAALPFKSKPKVEERRKRKLLDQ